LIVSGGHTNLYRCAAPWSFEHLGSTIDDAAGEAFDKVAKMLGLPYPGGPAVSRVALNGDRNAHRFPRSFLDDESRLDFSFSGLKTAVRYTISGPGKPLPDVPTLTPTQIADIAASFQEAVVDCLIGKAFLALRRAGLMRLCVGGGVAANARLRERLQEEADRRGVELHVAPLALCTDNAVMGAIAVERFQAGLVEPLDLDITPGLVRG
jgi:N6-L-threonylcarbamoyladenine synthase